MPSLRPSAQGFAGNASDLYTTPFPHALGERARDKNGNEYMFVDFGAASMSIGSVVHISAAGIALPLSTTAPTAAGGGRVGVVVAASPTSVQGGWVQIYGFALVQADAGAGTGAASASDVTDTSTRVIGATTVVTSPQGAISLTNLLAAASVPSSVEVDEIMGMWLVPQAEATDFPGFSGDLSAFDNVVSGAAVTQVSETSGIGVTNTTAGISTNLASVFLNYPYHSNGQRIVQIGGTS